MKMKLFSFLLIATVVFAIAACKKTDANAAFVGTYNGTYTTVGGGTGPDTITITTGSSSDAIILLEKKNGITFNGTVSSNTITIPSQTVSIAGGSYPLSGTGALSGNALTLNLTEVISGTSVNVSFTGSK